MNVVDSQVYWCESGPARMFFRLDPSTLNFASFATVPDCNDGFVSSTPEGWELLFATHDSGEINRLDHEADLRDVLSLARVSDVARDTKGDLYAVLFDEDKIVKAASEGTTEDLITELVHPQEAEVLDDTLLILSKGKIEEYTLNGDIRRTVYVGSPSAMKVVGSALLVYDADLDQLLKLSLQ